MQPSLERRAQQTGPRGRALTAWLALCELLWLGCGGAAPQLAQSSAETPVAPEALPAAASSPTTLPAEPEQARASEPDRSRSLPRECTRVGELCLPPRDFVRRLCQGASTVVAFHLLSKDTPFSRGFVRARKVPPVNVLGGPSSDANLEFGEEVLILTHTDDGAAGKMQVSGMGGYDVLRWDGTCANLADGELALRAPIPPKHAPIEWRYVDEPVQEALLKDEGIREARKQQRQHCHGVTLGSRSPQCVAADARLEDRIFAAVRGGFALPPLAEIP
ncbi:MAG TPA: hypothetical protein VG963_25210 [Polyangiaceae bacterium]|nr:hypothetical protein [Polyangiaceae bacterium]